MKSASISSIRTALRTHCQRDSRHQVRLFSQLTAEVAGRRAHQLAIQESSVRTSDNNNTHLNTLLAHAGLEEGLHNAPMSPPLHLATTHTRPPDGVYLQKDSKYGRADNPTRLLLEKTVYGLETIHCCHDKDSSILPPSFAFSSGMMAVTALVLAHTGPITVILPDDVYHGVPTVLTNVFSRHNVTIAKVDMMHVDSIIDKVKQLPLEQDVIVWMETPSNPLCKVLDIQTICKRLEPIKHTRQNITTVVDGTMVSPVITRPLEVSL